MAVPEGATAESRQPKRALAVVVGIVFVDLLGFGVVIPILPYYVRSFAVSDAVIGLLAASYSLMQFLAAPTLGRLSDERGRRPVILLSLLGGGIAWTVFGVAGEVGAVGGTALGVAVLFLSRMLAGAMGGNIAAANAYIADVTAPERRAGALGLLGASFSLGFIFGPALGGLAASGPVVAAADAALPEFVPTTQYSLPSFLAAGLSLSAMMLAFRYLEEPNRRRGSVERKSMLDTFREALADPKLRGLVIAFFLASVAFSGVQVMFIPFAADIYGYGTTEVALFLTYIGVLGALNQGVLVGRLSRVVAPSRLAVAGAALLAAALGMLPFSPELGRALLPWVSVVSPELAWLLVSGAVLSLGNGLLNVSLSTLVSTGASADRQGSAFGVTQGAGSLGRTVGPPLMGVLYVATYWSPFIVGALVILPVLGLLAQRAR
ncbi:MFS transporter [Halolamina sp.]|jgi:MFS family permease|uniref:MFS transporter n=1 Tax=Halolamina sp. TaxID=1940283 RepID=UPI000223BD43|nr:major facilitator superfamily MFS_1 [halophilic archaeon DL31]